MIDQNLQTNTQPPLIPTTEREKVVSAIRSLRQEWETVAGNTALIAIDSSVGLLLADLVVYLELNPTDRKAALGDHLTATLMQLEIF